MRPCLCEQIGSTRPQGEKGQLTLTKNFDDVGVVTKSSHRNLDSCPSIHKDTKHCPSLPPLYLAIFSTSSQSSISAENMNSPILVMVVLIQGLMLP